MSFKLIFILSVCMIVFANADLDEGLKEFFDACVTESGTTKEEAMKLKEHDFSSNDPKVKVKNTKIQNFTFLIKSIF